MQTVQRAERVGNQSGNGRETVGHRRCNTMVASLWADGSPPSNHRAARWCQAARHSLFQAAVGRTGAFLRDLREQGTARVTMCCTHLYSFQRGELWGLAPPSPFKERANALALLIAQRGAPGRWSFTSFHIVIKERAMSSLWLLTQIPLPALVLGVLCCFFSIVLLLALVVFVPGADRKIERVIIALSRLFDSMCNKTRSSAYFRQAHRTNKGVTKQGGRR